MHQTQVVSYRIEGVLSERLHELAEAERFWLRETSQISACQNLVQFSPPTVLVLRLGGQIERELSLLETVHACVPGTAVVAVGEADNPVLAGLVWELGATFALFPPTPVETITDLVKALLKKSAP